MTWSSRTARRRPRSGADLGRDAGRGVPPERFSPVHWTRSTSQPVSAALSGRRSWARSTLRADPMGRSTSSRTTRDRRGSAWRGLTDWLLCDVRPPTSRCRARARRRAIRRGVPPERSPPDPTRSTPETTTGDNWLFHRTSIIAGTWSTHPAAAPMAFARAYRPVELVRIRTPPRPRPRCPRPAGRRAAGPATGSHRF